MMANPQLDLLAGVSAGRPPSVDQAEIRRRLHRLLDTARASTEMPWSAQEARANALVFHQMANWLPDEERESLRRAFRHELDRLGKRATG
jgi:hypothetical protein